MTHRAEIRQTNTAARATRRAIMDDSQRTEIHSNDTRARALSQNILSDARRTEIRQRDRNTHQTQRAAPVASSAKTQWWDQVAVLNASQSSKPLGLRWNRVSRYAINSVSHTLFYWFLRTGVDG